MSSEIKVSEPPHKRKFRSSSKPGKMKNKPRNIPGGSGNKVKVDKRMKQLFRKRARNYNSDDEDEDEEEEKEEEEEEEQRTGMSADDGYTEYKEDSDGYSEEIREEDEVGSDDEGDVVQSGITRFGEGCRAFKIAFTKIVNKTVSDDLLGPVLSGHKKLIAEKLAEELSERKDKGEAKKDRHVVAEKGHVKPANFLDSHEKFLIGVATKGVVKLFNAVNKAQNAQKGLNPSRFKDAKALGKRKRAAFFTELRKKPSQAGDTSLKGAEGDDGPAWAPLRDSYMLTNSRLKNWDKMPVKTDVDEAMHHGSSSDED